MPENKVVYVKDLFEDDFFYSWVKYILYDDGQKHKYLIKQLEVFVPDVKKPFRTIDKVFGDKAELIDKLSFTEYIKKLNGDLWYLSYFIEEFKISELSKDKIYKSYVQSIIELSIKKIISKDIDDPELRLLLYGEEINPKMVKEIGVRQIINQKDIISLILKYTYKCLLDFVEKIQKNCQALLECCVEYDTEYLFLDDKKNSLDRGDAKDVYTTRLEQVKSARDGFIKDKVINANLGLSKGGNQTLNYKEAARYATDYFEFHQLARFIAKNLRGKDKDELTEDDYYDLIQEYYDEAPENVLGFDLPEPEFTDSFFRDIFSETESRQAIRMTMLRNNLSSHKEDFKYINPSTLYDNILAVKCVDDVKEFSDLVRNVHKRRVFEDKKELSFDEYQSYAIELYSGREQKKLNAFFTLKESNESEQDAFLKSSLKKQVMSMVSYIHDKSIAELEEQIEKLRIFSNVPLRVFSKQLERLIEVKDVLFCSCSEDFSENLTKAFDEYKNSVAN